MLNLSTKIIGDLIIPVPSLAEQSDISNLLGTWDKAVKIAERLVVNAKNPALSGFAENL